MSDEKTPAPVKMGAPRKEFAIDQFRKLCRMQCTLAECADWFDVSEDTIERRCKDYFQLTFAEVFKKFSAGGKCSLRRWQFQAAQKGNTALLIFLGKQYLGQRDIPVDGEDDIIIPQPLYAVASKP